MNCLLQDLAKGGSIIKEAPTPLPSDGSVLLATKATLISAGTEKMLVSFGKASYLEKARQQPEKVKMVLEKIKTDGLMPTVEAVRSKLAQPLPLGYCHVGVVVGVGKDARFKKGERLVSNGSHADMVKVGENLCAAIPDTVDDETATFTVLASISLQGIRLVQPTLGESVVVIGVGLIGLLTVQLLRAQGCRVLAIDFDVKKLQLAKQFGAEICNLQQGEDPVAAGMLFSQGYGVDAVLITASTQSSDPVTQAARMSRKRGRIVLVGVTGLHLNRADFYEKELTFQVSCSYGPGRYEDAYEEQGLDYPIGFVRWTEQRNFEAVLELMAKGQLNVKPLITHRFVFEEAPKAYDTLMEDVSVLGIVLTYASEVTERIKTTIPLNAVTVFDKTKPILGIIGAGNYAARILIPSFKSAGAQFHSLVTSNGINAVIAGEKAGFTKASTDTQALLADQTVNTVVIATRHDSHASLVVEALKKGKHVFVEKPLALTQAEVTEVEIAYQSLPFEKKPHLMVGFNRRFSPQIQKIKHLLMGVKLPKSIVMTVNAGAIPNDHWVQDRKIGGGRIIGEACHFIDLIRFLVDCKITSIQARRLGDVPGLFVEDNATITLGFADGSLGVIHYFANGASSFPKERVEIFTAGRVLQLDNFRNLKGFGWPGFKRMRLWRQDKGQQTCTAYFLQAIEQGRDALIPFEEVIEIARATITVAEQLDLQQE